MNTLAQRLLHILEKKGLSQSEAARMTGMSQQSLNYIINNDLPSSKMAPRLAEALDVNAEWLIFGRGKPELTLVYELPVLQSPYQLMQFFNNELNLASVTETTIDAFLGEQAFAYLWRPNELAICAESQEIIEAAEFLVLADKEVSVQANSSKDAYPIFEWRKRYGHF